jgi:hypothetical protein
MPSQQPTIQMIIHGFHAGTMVSFLCVHRIFGVTLLPIIIFNRPVSIRMNDDWSVSS